MALTACTATAPEEPAEPVELTEADYLSAEILLIDDDLVSVFTGMSQNADREALSAYAACVVAQYALNKGFTHARQIRTTYKEEAGVRYGDAVYTLSETKPKGIDPIDASATVTACALQEIPTAGKGQA